MILDDPKKREMLTLLQAIEFHIGNKCSEDQAILENCKRLKELLKEIENGNG